MFFNQLKPNPQNTCSHLKALKRPDETMQQQQQQKTKTKNPTMHSEGIAFDETVSTIDL